MPFFKSLGAPKAPIRHHSGRGKPEAKRSRPFCDRVGWKGYVEEPVAKGKAANKGNSLGVVSRAADPSGDTITITPL